MNSQNNGMHISTNSGYLRRKSSIKGMIGKATILFGKNQIDHNKSLPNNTIRTTKYNIFTFLPKSLFIQFKRSANIYFLLVSILTCLSFSPKQPSSMIGTFIFVLICTMLKDGIEDYGRYKQDNQSNNRNVTKLEDGIWKEVKCWTLKPGDIIKVTKDEEYSADTLIMQSSNDTGYCYIDTKNLDGETNLKEKCAIEEFRNLSNREVTNIKGSIESEKPNENITSWEGVVVYNQNQIYVSLKNFILKGCTLKNTEFSIGIVVYSGHDTKIMRNSKRPVQKVSKVLLTMNRLLYSLFALDIVICVIFACLNFNFVHLYGPVYDYIFPKYNSDDIENNTIIRFGFAFLTFFVAYSQIIPISLYVALEIIKIIQGVLIFYDPDLYDSEMKKPATCRTTDLIEELGQVEFIFSDKTGTLTQNSMVLKKCFINNKIYGFNQTDKEDSKFSINGDMSAYNKIVSHLTEDAIDKQKLEEFFGLLAMCHSVFPENTDKGIMYQGSSPDEIALVKGAQQLGIEFTSKDFSDLILTNHITKETFKYEIKCEMPFDSDRKRMSVVVQDKSSKRLIILSKGADNVMLGTSGKKPVITNFSHDSELENTQFVLNSFSREGLRILVMGHKILDIEVYKKWEKRYNEFRKKGHNLNELYSELETDLHYLGISAIEDKLQEGVSETIYNLLRCGIRIWVLTGDKQDTAIEIARSCKLIDEKTHCLDLSTDIESVEQRLKEVGEQLSIENFEDSNSEIDLDKISEFIKEMTDQDLSIIIDGATLEIVLDDIHLSKLFFLISVAARSVVCCRVSPKQKAKVVKLVKSNGNWITLSIGDGTNDVPMIMEAHIGIGIQGKEGTQAARSADYAISQFKFLEKLILVYGRNGYIKITKFICYYFYKNIILVFSELALAFFDGFSGQIFFADYLGTMYNAFFTSWPCLFTFSLETEHNLILCKKFPILYKAGPKNYYFNFRTFWKYIIYATIHSILAFYIPTIGLQKQINADGFTYNHWRISTISFSCVIHIVTYKLLLISEFWNVINIIAVFIAIAFYYLCLIILSSETFAINFQPELMGVAKDILTNFKSLLIIVFLPLVAIIPDIVFKQIQYNNWSTPPMLIRRFIKSPELKKILLTDPSDARRSIINPDMGQGSSIIDNHHLSKNFHEITDGRKELKKSKSQIKSANIDRSQNSRIYLRDDLVENVMALRNLDLTDNKIREKFKTDDRKVKENGSGDSLNINRLEIKRQSMHNHNRDMIENGSPISLKKRLEFKRQASLGEIRFNKELRRSTFDDNKSIYKDGKNNFYPNKLN